MTFSRCNNRKEMPGHFKTDEIHSELGRKLDWRSMPEKQSARILLEKKIDPGKASNRKAVYDWFTKWTPKIYLTFKNRIKELVEPEKT